MILFLADNHYNARPGYYFYEKIKDEYDVDFHESDLSILSDKNKVLEYDLIILNMIIETDAKAVLPEGAEESIKAYLEGGKSMFLMHGSSAAFWPWSWWRKIVGKRWVRGNDPDGSEKSTHPVRPFSIKKVKNNHPLTSKLKDVKFSSDEIYIHLEEVCSYTELMSTTTDEGTFSQVLSVDTPWKGEFIQSIPGHAKEVVQHEDNVYNCKEAIDYLLSK